LSIVKFGKDHYKWYGGYEHKADAERNAKHIKEDGKKYRIVKKVWYSTTWNTPPYKRKETTYTLYYNLSSSRSKRRK
jgi:hypothetical protein